MIQVSLLHACDNCGGPAEKDEILCVQCKAKNAEKKARAMIAKRTTYQLIADWEETEKQTMSTALPLVRGWIMDELEKRDPIAFDAWLESIAVEGPRKFFTGE